MNVETTLFKSESNARYKIAPHVTLGKIEEDLVAIKSQTITKISAEGMANFVEAILGQLSQEKGVSIEELSAYTGASEDELLEVLNVMVENNVLIKFPQHWTTKAILISERSGMQVCPEEIIKRLESSVISFYSSDNNPLAQTIYASLENAGLNVVKESTFFNDESGTIRLIVASSYLDPLLKKANETALLDGKPWLSVVANDGQVSWVGPFFIPHKSACLTCFNIRKAANFTDDVFRAETLKIRPLKGESHPVYDEPINQIQAGIVANALTEWIALREFSASSVPGGFTTINIDDRGISMDNHRVYRVPRCPDCSPAASTGYPQVWFHGN